MDKKFIRVKRLERQIHTVLSNILRNLSLSDEFEFLSDISLLHVNLKKNLSIADCIIKDYEAKNKNYFSILKENTKKIRHLLALELNIRFCPEINFVKVDSDSSTDVDNILERINSENNLAKV